MVNLTFFNSEKRRSEKEKSRHSDRNTLDKNVNGIETCTRLSHWELSVFFRPFQTVHIHIYSYYFTNFSLHYKTCMKIHFPLE